MNPMQDEFMIEATAAHQILNEEAQLYASPEATAYLMQELYSENEKVRDNALTLALHLPDEMLALKAARDTFKILFNREKNDKLRYRVMTQIAKYAEQGDLEAAALLKQAAATDPYSVIQGWAFFYCGKVSKEARPEMIAFLKQQWETQKDFRAEIEESLKELQRMNLSERIQAIYDRARQTLGQALERRRAANQFGSIQPEPPLWNERKIEKSDLFWRHYYEEGYLIVSGEGSGEAGQIVKIFPPEEAGLTPEEVELPLFMVVYQMRGDRYGRIRYSEPGLEQRPPEIVDSSRLLDKESDIEELKKQLEGSYQYQLKSERELAKELQRDLFEDELKSAWREAALRFPKVLSDPLLEMLESEEQAEWLR